MNRLNVEFDVDTGESPVGCAKEIALTRIADRHGGTSTGAGTWFAGEVPVRDLDFEFNDVRALFAFGEEASRDVPGLTFRVGGFVIGGEDDE